MRLHACLPNTFWQDAAETALHIYNRQPMRRSKWICPITLWNGKKPDVSYFKTFGCQAYVFIPKEDRQNKLSPKSEEMIFIGYETGTKGYRFWSSSKHRVVIQTTATFDESILPRCPKEQVKDKQPEPPHTTQESLPNQDSDSNSSSEDDDPLEPSKDIGKSNPKPSSNTTPGGATPPSPKPPPPQRNATPGVTNVHFTYDFSCIYTYFFFYLLWSHDGSHDIT